MACFAAPTAGAERLLMDGRVDDAVRMLQGQLAANPGDADDHLLLCRAYLSELQADSAIHECEIAVKLTPRRSSAHDWLGRAYGLKADNAGPLTGLKMALRVRDAFQAAVAFDPHNQDAANDLGEYYVAAPSVVGGGFDKATALAKTIEPEMPQLAHRIRARNAEKSKDYPTAEREFRAAIAVKNAPDAWVDLGGFYQRMKMNDKAIDALKNAIAADKSKGPAVVDAASFLIDMRVAAEVATKALREYLASGAKSDAAPVIRVHLLLSTLLKNAGDADGAKIELNKALELAANYGPAKRALKGL